MAEEVKVRIILKEVYECYVVADDDEQAERLAYLKHCNGDTELVYDGIEYVVEA